MLLVLMDFTNILANSPPNTGLAVKPVLFPVVVSYLHVCGYTWFNGRYHFLNRRELWVHQFVGHDNLLASIMSSEPSNKHLDVVAVTSTLHVPLCIVSKTKVSLPKCSSPISSEPSDQLFLLFHKLIVLVYCIIVHQPCNSRVYWLLH